MRRALAIALLQFRMTFRSRGALLTMFGLPLALTLFFGGLAGGGGGGAPSGRVYPVAAVDLDGSFASRNLIDLLDRETAIRVRRAAPGELDRLLADQEVEAGVVIPAGFEGGITGGAAPEVQLIPRPGREPDPGVAASVQAAVLRLGFDLRLALHLLREADPRAAAGVAEAYGKVAAARDEVRTTVATHALTRQEAEDPPGSSYAAVGFTVAFVMMQCFMMGGVILDERRLGTWSRLLAAPASRAEVLGGYLLSFFLTGMAQFAILVAATRLLFQVSWGPLLPLLAMGSGTVLSAAGMGLFLAGILKTPEQQAGIGIVFTHAAAMLGGAYWDLGTVSETMRRIGYLTPHAWAIHGFKEVVLRGGSWPEIALPLAVLLGVAAVFMAVGVLRIRYE